MFKLKLFRLVFVCALVLLSFVVSSVPVQAQSAAASLDQEIEDFFAAGADGYLVWQYSGNKGNGEIFASDPYAFFQHTPDGEAICKVLKEKAEKYPGKFLGVNMWDAGGGAHSGDKIRKHLQYLHDSCGTTVVRIFAKTGGVQKVLDAANGTGVKILVAVGDYSNGSPGLDSKVGSEWFPTTVEAINNRDTGNEFYNQTATVAALKDHPSFWGAEVANEIHCRGDDEILDDYRDLGEAFARLFGGYVGFGQKASEDTTKCDSPGVIHEGQSHFSYTNEPSIITISSAHYYNPAEKALALKAAQQAKQQGKIFYIGEAPPKLNADSNTDPTKNVNYQTIPYDFNTFYIHPVLGLSEKNKDLIRDDLIKQGYEARCAAPGFEIELSQEGVNAMNKFLECGSQGCNSPGGNGGVLGGLPIEGAPDTQSPNPLSPRIVSTLTVDYREALIPILRDMNRLPQLKRSLEDYFGHKEPAVTNYNLAETRSAAINSLLTSNQRCVQSAISLLQREIMCEKLQNPDACALYDTAVPETALNVKGLLGAYKAFANGRDHQEVCTDIVAGPDSELRRGMLGLPLQIQNSYRLAFLVTTIRTKVPFPGSMMNLFQHPKRGPLGVGPDPKHVVIVTAFKVPDITTNKGTIPGEGESGHTSFNDPAMLTRDVLIPSNLRDQLNEDGIAERQRLLDKGREVALLPQDDETMEIECMLSGVGGPQCSDPLTGALVDMINAQRMIQKENSNLRNDRPVEDLDLSGPQQEQFYKLLCDEEAAFETADYIFDPAQLDPLQDEGRIFKTDWGAAILENLFTDETHMVAPGNPGGQLNPMYADTNTNKTGGWHWGLKSIFYVTEENKGSFGASPDGDPREVRHFIVYPEGYDIRTIEAVMSGTFFSSQQIEDLKEKSKLYDQIEIKDDVVEFDGGSDSHSFEDKTDCDEVTKIGPLGPYTDYECPTLTFGFRLNTSEEPNHAGVLGGRLGYWMYTIQLQLQKAEALTHQYLENCDSIEDFLLDACGGASVSQVSVGANVSADFTDISSFQIRYWNGADVIFQPPSQELWDAIVAAAERHNTNGGSCDPWLILAVAHSESQSYTNHTTPNHVGALGVFQFTPGSWGIWTRANATGVNQCSLHQPSTFTTNGLDFSSPTNIAAAADAACRLIMWTGAPRYYDDQSQFIRAFAQQGDNQYRQIWNAHTPQADYVWRLWHKLLETAGKDPMPARTDYPYPRCS